MLQTLDLSLIKVIPSGSYLFEISPVNRITSIGLIFLMSLQCCYKLGVITYFDLNRDYIAEVLCINKEEPLTICHGQCFLNKNLKVAESASGDQATDRSGKEKIDFPVFLISENILLLRSPIKSTLENFRYICGFASDHRRSPFHPPSLVS